MSRFFVCFRAKHKHDFQPSVALVDPPSTIIRKARVSHIQLSDLFVSQEMEELSDRDKIKPPGSVDMKVVDPVKQPLQPWTPAKSFELKNGLDLLRETPTSCISDPPNASRNSVSTIEKSEKGEFPPLITHPCYTQKETFASQTFSPSNHEYESDTSSTLVSSSFPDAHGSDNQNGFDEPCNQIYSIQKLKNGPAALQKMRGRMSPPLKPVSSKKIGSKPNIRDELSVYEHTDRSPRDMPLLQTLTAHRNENVKPCSVPLKWWENGIPNSTNKYREDQIVSWDVTPFEERLEKALSDANSISQIKHSSRSHITLEDENDTAASHLQSLPNPKSVVSF